MDFWYGVGLGFCAIEAIFVLAWLVYCFYGPKRVHKQASLQQKTIKEKEPVREYEMWLANQSNAKHIKMDKPKAAYHPAMNNKLVADHKLSAKELPMIEQEPLVRNGQAQQFLWQDGKKHVGANRQKDYDADTTTTDIQEKQQLVKADKSKRKIEALKRRSDPDTIAIETFDENSTKSKIFD
ncbi:hypothetical protein M3Y96_00169900 [Aphelenchoides besseyi]|nr:hypothetical protein M3Y96_00169900 [Aphelenchoides besseyi]